MTTIDPKDLQEIEEDIIKTEALLDQAQANVDVHRHLWPEEYAYQIQSDIDIKRFHLEMHRLTIKMLRTLTDD